MEEKLSQEDIELIEFGIDFNRRVGNKMFGFGIIISMAGSIFLYAFGVGLLVSVLMMLGMIILSLFLEYYIFGRSKKLLERDLKRGVKYIQTATVKKLKSSKKEMVYVLSDNLKITDSDLEEEDIKSIKIGQQLILSYTPYCQMILKVNSSIPMHKG